MIFVRQIVGPIAARFVAPLERARRAVRWCCVDEGYEVLSAGENKLCDATLMFLTDAPKIRINGELFETEKTTRWGFDFRAVTLDLEASQTKEIS